MKPPPKQTDPYYGRAARKQWTADVKQRAGGVCQDPQHEGPRLVCKGVADHDKERRDKPEQREAAARRVTGKFARPPPPTAQGNRMFG